jgi:hypothetical protein
MGALQAIEIESNISKVCVWKYNFTNFEKIHFLRALVTVAKIFKTP